MLLLKIRPKLLNGLNNTFKLIRFFLSIILESCAKKTNKIP